MTAVSVFALILTCGLGVALAVFVLAYVRLARINRELTAPHRESFYKDVDTLLASGELSLFAERMLLFFLRNMFRRRELFQLLRFIRRRLNGSEPRKRLFDVREHVPEHLREVWQRAMLGGLYSITGAEPILGFALRGLLEFDPKNHKTIEVASSADAVEGRLLEACPA